MKKILLALMIFGLYGCNTTRIIDPLPTEVPSSLNIEDVYCAIMRSLRDVPVAGVSAEKTGNGTCESLAREIDAENPGWHHEYHDGNVIHAGFFYERFYIRAEVTYSRDFINYSLVESKNLVNDPELSHSMAYAWLARLEGDVRRSLETIDRHKRENSQASVPAPELHSSCMCGMPYTC